MKFKKHKHVFHELRSREYGVPSPSWTSLKALRYAVFGPRRKWTQILNLKERLPIEIFGDLLYKIKPAPSGGAKGIMHRITGEGQLLQMYKMKLNQRPKEVKMYDVPPPVYCSKVPQQEYQPSLFLLQRGNVLSRRDLNTGIIYNTKHLGLFQSKTMSLSYMDDMLIVKSNKLKQDHPVLYHFHVFQLHPFKHIASFIIDGGTFPGEEDKKDYGRLRDVEIHDGLLLVMTDKKFCLVYDAQTIIEEKKKNSGISMRQQIMFNPEVLVPEAPELLVTEVPPLLFATYTHLDILGLGACPWAYIRAVSDLMLEVRDLKTQELLVGGQVTWEDSNDQQVSPDYLMFHPDDSSRLIQVRTSKLRFFAIREHDGHRFLKKEFTYPPNEEKKQKSGRNLFSRSGRLLKTKFEWDHSLNRALAFNIETELNILLILEAQRDEKCCTQLVKVTFYDSFTYEYLDELAINKTVLGDIETNKLSVHMDRDMLNVVSIKGSEINILSYRLKETWRLGRP